MRPGLYLVHKNEGQTSSSLVRAFLAEDPGGSAGERPLRACHGGVLDPFACGLVLLLAGKATRLMKLLHGVPKTYLASIRFGSETDTGDALGRVVARADPSRLTLAGLEEALAGFLGERNQVPPATSNKRVRGERAYVLAHRGEEVDLPPSSVYLHEARIRAHALPGGCELLLVCGGGYYVRALARDLGRALGCRAHLAALRRLSIGPFQDPPSSVRTGVFGEDLLSWCATRRVEARELQILREGGAIERARIEPARWRLPPGFPDPRAPLRGMRDGRLVALLGEEPGKLRAVAHLGRGI